MPEPAYRDITPAAEPLSATPIAIQESGHPLLIGYRAVRANLLPGLALQGLMLATVYAYFWLPWARPAFDRLGDLKARGGLYFTLASSIIAGAFVPETFKWFISRPRPAARRAVADFAFAVAFYGFGAVVVDFMYRAQASWFGTEPTLATLIKKVSFDQFVYTAFWGTPFAVCCFAWKNAGYRWPHGLAWPTPALYTRRCLPTLLTNWSVWIPVVAMLYSLPSLLQIPIYSFVLCFWALILAYIHAR